MRIGYDAKRAYMNATGLGMYSRNLIQSVIKDEAIEQVYLYTPKKKSSFLKGDKKTAIVLPFSWLPRILLGLWRSFGIGFWVNSSKLDIYHGLSAELPFGIGDKTKKILTVHDTLFNRYPEDYPWVDRILARWKLGYALSQADKVIAVSQSTKEDVIRYYSVDTRKIEVIYVPIQVESKKFTSYQVHPRPYILCVSSFIPRKNQILLIQAFEQIADNVDYDLVMIGSGRHYLKECYQYIKKSKYRKRIFVEQGLRNEMVASYYQSALFSVCPSLYEGFGIPIVESIIYDCPVLASNNPAHVEVGQGRIKLFQKDSLHSLTTSLLEMTNHIEDIRKEQMKDKAEFLNLYSPDRIARQVLEVYRGSRK